ncbi:AraC family transcriptional regulator [Stieleria varia]|uniref:Transcriptional regulator EutR n=1 Tax=Stieleria varia TaxID=2528005 RepID=A0A5C6B5J1_9BACT|nr:transcriptional regulator EutR [Stieleria varia]
MARLNFQLQHAKATVTTTFTNFEAYAEAIHDADLDVRLLHPYERCWSIQQREIGSLRLQHGIEGSGLLTQGAVKPEGWAFYFLRSGAPVPLNGKLLVDGSIAVLPPRSEFRFSGRGPVEWYTVYIPSICLAVPDKIPTELGSAGVIEVDGRLIHRIRSALDAAFPAATSRSSDTCSDCVAETIQANLLFVFRELFEERTSSTRPIELKSEVNRKALICRAIELVNDTSAWESSVPEIATMLGVSQRTLLATFQEQLGLTPKTYLLNHRHHLARRVLMNSTPHSTTVAAVAMKFGFFDIGRFAGRYFQIFGEYPSETLRRGS